MGTESDELRQLIKQYATAQHNRPMPPISIAPEDQDTSGNNNVYWYSGGVNAHFGSVEFGLSANTANHILGVEFRLPDDYVAGEDFTLELLWTILNNSGGAETISYNIACGYIRDGIARTSSGGEGNGTWTGTDNSIYNKETSTVTGTNYQVGDLVSFLIQA